ncbi:LEAF RUST 10 DISEASE-RESISTANCE LOCUS RECEPTOR-LIKE PROTEIN KINASE-like 1.4 isoform X1 [Solanum stenotomum]|uniref:LEAF RUST 10 DISEASE-RESISTANCE LOCUS RECEPTOR-LIKE PROTEIN KINASE-like 1.4 isoform X1 n=1 Tax=Solanum stenotomum TaxID=172797 RepID=UPI0020D073FA|nr:LEAF RUST 10 DISEASE-RESISTANCE LOCUS RECEPTOR-LIKE PROTEIN KINASE-like 1.4 isoform X1 [Solanum stenotomum]
MTLSYPSTTTNGRGGATTTTTLFFATFILTTSFSFSFSFSDDNVLFPNCHLTFSCGSIRNITYPFTGGDRPNYCGLPDFKLRCVDDKHTEFTHQSLTYRVLSINQSSTTMTVSRIDLWKNSCPSQFINTIFNSTLFNIDRNEDEELSLSYGCDVSALVITPQNLLNCSVDGLNFTGAFYLLGPIPNDPFLNVITCTTMVTVPMFRTVGKMLYSNEITLGEALMQGFSVKYDTPYDRRCSECKSLGGNCGFIVGLSQLICICGEMPCTFLREHSHERSSQDNRKKNQMPLAVGISVGGAVLAGIGVGWLVFFCRQKRKRIASQASASQTERKDLPILSSSNGLSSSSTPSSTTFTRSIPSYPSSKSEADCGRGSSYFGAHVFSFAELEEATNNFDPSKELGDGGFGVVYYGKLHDGRVVAVKRLYENNFKRVEQFMNEVEILTKLRHKNLVLLYGCTSKRSRDLLLVYEYIPNGTVADHLHGKQAKSGLLSWPVRMNIAIETAEALAYLHSSVIIHRDVKTNNILLDNDFHVKVADFGLSRLFPTNVTHVSTAPQGTPGYVDPEYYQCYQLTEKSDVYSFGVVLVELISSLEAVDTNRHRHDINLSNMAVNKIQGHSIHELVDPSLGYSTNSSVRRMTTLVAELAFRCLQQDRDLRPSMQEVLETLRGIQNGESKAHNAEVLDIVVDDVGLLKDSFSSPDSVATGK